MRIHPFPCRTRKLSSQTPKVLGWKRPGRIGSCQIKETPETVSFLFGSLVESQARWQYSLKKLKDSEGKSEGLVRREDKVLSSRAATHRGMESGGFPY